MKRHHAKETHDKLTRVIQDAKHVESKLWSLIGDKHKLPETLNELNGLVRIGIYELKKIEEFDHHLFKLEKTKIAKDIDYDLKKLEDLISTQIEKLKDMQMLSAEEIMSILDGAKKTGSFSETSQLIHTILERLEKR